MYKRIILVLLTLALIFPSCKKGSNDPFVSFKSRKSRVVGKWKATSYSHIESSGSSIFLSHIMENGIYNETSSNWGNTTGTETYSIEFKNDGTWSMTNGGDVAIINKEGKWNFTEKTGDNKNKNHIVLMLTKSSDPNFSNTYEGDNFDKIYSLDELRNKKMVWKNSSTVTEIMSGLTNTNTVDETWVWQVQ